MINFLGESLTCYLYVKVPRYHTKSHEEDQIHSYLHFKNVSFPNLVNFRGEYYICYLLKNIHVAIFLVFYGVLRLYFYVNVNFPNHNVYKYKYIASKFGCTCNHLMKYGISHPTFYRNVASKARKFKLNLHGLKIHLNKLICKGHRHSIIIKSLKMVFIVTNIDFLVKKLNTELLQFIFVVTFSYSCLYIFILAFAHSHVFFDFK